MSALGQKRTFALRNAMSALSPESGHLEGRMVTMALVKTELEPSHLQRNADDFAVVRSIERERWPRTDAKHEQVGLGFPGSWRLSAIHFWAG